MTFDQIIARLQKAQGNPEQLMLDAVEMSVQTHFPRLHGALEAAAIAHWFDERILARVLSTSEAEASTLVQSLITLPVVESFASRNGWNVHESTRIALRRRIFEESPAEFVEMSARAAACWPGEDVVSRVENIYHRLCSHPRQGSDDLENTYWTWRRNGQQEATQALGTALEELLRFPLSEPAKGRMLLVLGWIRMPRVPLNETERIAQQAVEILERTGPPTSCSNAHSLLARVFEHEGNLASATAECEKALAIMRDLHSRNESNTESQRALSLALNDAGRVYQTQGRFSEALALFEESKRLMEQVAALDPENTVWQKDLSKCHAAVGGIYSAQKRRQEALEEFRAYKRIMEQLAARDASNPYWQYNLSVACNRVGNVYLALGRLEEALEEYQAYQRIVMDLTALDPGNTEWQRELSVSHSNIGGVLRRQGLLEEALNAYETSKWIRIALTSRDPMNTGWQRDLARAHRTVGSILMSQGDKAAALAEYQAAFGILEWLVSHDTSNARWQDDLRTMQNLIHAVGR